MADFLLVFLLSLKIIEMSLWETLVCADSCFHSNCSVNNSYGRGQIHNKAVITFIKLSERKTLAGRMQKEEVEPALTCWSISSICDLHVVCFALIMFWYHKHMSEYSKPSILYRLPERETFINPSFLLNYLHVSGNMSLIYLDTPISSFEFDTAAFALNGNWSSLTEKTVGRKCWSF